MAFKSIANDKSEPQKRASWLDDPVPESTSKNTSTQQPISNPFQSAPVNQASAQPNLSSSDGHDRVWVYKGMVKTELKHKLPYRLEKAILGSYDFQNWFETVWMVLVQGNRWTCQKLFVPDHLQERLGAKAITIDESMKMPGTVVWTLEN